MSKKITTKDFILRAQKIHNKKYNYSKFIYIKSNIKGIIICPIHGKFYQLPNDHISGHGCLLCCGNKKLTTDEFIKKAKLIHKNKYDYSKVEYNNRNSKIEIICLNHGSFFQHPYHHLEGKGCPICCNKISKPEIEFLNYFNIKNRNISMKEWKLKKVDGYDEKTHTIYEFLGDYYHGNPEKYNLKKYNPTCHKTYGELYQDTFKKFDKLKSFGYNIKYIWENDWNKFKNDINKEPKILIF